MGYPKYFEDNTEILLDRLRDKGGYVTTGDSTYQSILSRYQKQDTKNSQNSHAKRQNGVRCFSF